MFSDYIMSKLTKFPLADIFDQIGLPDCVRLLEEASRYEPLARRFSDEWYHRKGKRNSAAAARMVHELDLDVGLFKNLLVRLYTQQQRSLARIKQAAQIPDLTDTSLDAANIITNREERVAHLQTSGVLDTPKGGINIETNVGVQMQNNALPSFEESIMQVEERMRQQLPAATQQFVDAEIVEPRKEAVPA